MSCRKCHRYKTLDSIIPIATAYANTMKVRVHIYRTVTVDIGEFYKFEPVGYKREDVVQIIDPS
jgi:hypothetical protein